MISLLNSRISSKVLADIFLLQIFFVFEIACVKLIVWLVCNQGMGLLDMLSLCLLMPV